MKAIAQYLERYAEKETRSLELWPRHQRFNRSLVIPVYDEAPAFIDRIRRSNHAHQLLLIAVINRPDNTDHCNANDELFEYLQKNFNVQWQQDLLSLFVNDDFGILVVDRHSNPIPAKQGVGLARKIGCDLATQLIFDQAVASPWIHSTDADAQLPVDYFQTDPLSASYSGATYSFQHIRDKTATAKATELYEKTLHDYVDGLARANSPYAFHTIGSIIAVNHLHYCQARGFPKRSGGEDFYLLNKLRKLGEIATLPALIMLEPRESHRVPFGTGPATAKILQELSNQETITTYNPDLFNQLSITLKNLTDTIENGESLSAALDKLPTSSQRALKSLDIEKCFLHLNSRNTKAWKLRHFHDWFDGFRTLKFVRFLQNNYFPNIPLNRYHSKQT